MKGRRARIMIGEEGEIKNGREKGRMEEWERKGVMAERN